MSSFGENLKKYRELAGFPTAKEFAEVLDIAYPTYVSYESNGREPKFELLCKIADLLNVSIDKLLGHETDFDFERIRAAMLLAGIDIRRTGEFGPRWGEKIEERFLPEVYGDNARTQRDDWYYTMPLVKRVLIDCKAEMEERISARLKLIFDLDSFNNTPGLDQHYANFYLDQFDEVTKNKSDAEIKSMMENDESNPFLYPNRIEKRNSK